MLVPTTCPTCHGDGGRFEQEVITVDMAIDAGDLSLEGQYVFDFVACPTCEEEGYVMEEVPDEPQSIEEAA